MTGGDANKTLRPLPEINPKEGVTSFHTGVTFFFRQALIALRRLTITICDGFEDDNPYTAETDGFQPGSGQRIRHKLAYSGGGYLYGRHSSPQQKLLRIIQRQLLL